MDRPKRSSEKRGVLLAVAGIVPLLLCLIFTFIDARQIVKRQQAATAGMLLAHAEAIGDRAWDTLDELQAFPKRPCEEINDELRKYAALSPYFRSIGVMREGRITCSSAFGGIHNDIATVIQRQPPTDRKAKWMLSLSQTWAVRDRPAVIFMHDTPAHSGAFVIVDGQYLLDVMSAVGKSQHNSIRLQFGGGFALRSGANGNQPSGLLQPVTLSERSSRYPIGVEVTSPASDIAFTWRQGLFTFVPMALILSLLLMTVTNNWLKRKLSPRDQLRKAILHREFSVNYQPVYHMVTGKASGAEVLMRWQRPDGHWVRPDMFITAAEAEEMIIPLTRHLMELVLEDAKQWSLPPDFRLALNVAAAHVQHDDFVEDIRYFARGMAIHRPDITLELTERSLLSDGEDVVQKLQLLRNEGIHIAIDDFGTGHCSLSYLQTFPLDYLKIDRGFVNAIESTTGEAPVLDAIITLSHKLGLKIVAEGVENATQLHYLQARGVVFIQGYYYARPMDNRLFMSWMQQEGQRPLV
ncbi:EAL domain-containing protein [Erwinia sp. DT-104]|uniref:cyclic-guanylate-specific phosphodiesterase n=1 Tax=Erwinia aeris TaxID=3239803 RepID=A0ABV4EAG6_9GAMM|nr:MULTISPECIES: EAL domain-containing protein [unclassified Erwinia]MDN4629382.1 EAL domain-containing protein [Erwinia sp. PsM31]MDN8543650.1 EAL domain-containing protein [Erwinia sp. BC051422]